MSIIWSLLFRGINLPLPKRPQEVIQRLPSLDVWLRGHLQRRDVCKIREELSRSRRRKKLKPETNNWHGLETTTPLTNINLFGIGPQLDRNGNLVSASALAAVQASSATIRRLTDTYG